MLRNSTPGRHPCNSTAVVPREMEQFVQQSQAWTWALIRPRIGSQGPRWWEAPVELFVPHIFPPTRRQSGHDVVVIVSFAYWLPLQTKLSVFAARRTLASTHLQAIHYSGTVAAVSLVTFLGSFPLDSRSLAVLQTDPHPVLASSIRISLLTPAQSFLSCKPKTSSSPPKDHLSPGCVPHATGAQRSYRLWPPCCGRSSQGLEPNTPRRDWTSAT